MRSAVDGELEALCRSCGLCCDGRLFGCVPLASGELQRARKNHLLVLPRGNAFEQPCSALAREGESCACSIYSDRPRSCRAFACRLHDRHRREGGPLEARVATVRRVHILLRTLETTTDHEARRAATAELIERMEESFGRA